MRASKSMPTETKKSGVEGVAKGSDVGHGLVPEVGLRDDESGEEGADGEREPRARRGERRAEDEEQHGEEEELLAPRRGDRVKDARDEESRGEEHEDRPRRPPFRAARTASRTGMPPPRPASGPMSSIIGTTIRSSKTLIPTRNFPCGESSSRRSTRSWQDDDRRAGDDEESEEEALVERRSRAAAASAAASAVTPQNWIGPAIQTAEPRRRRLESGSSRPTVKRSRTTPTCASASTVPTSCDEPEPVGPQKDARQQVADERRLAQPVAVA